MPRLKASAQTSLSARLLAWYDRHRRVLPWRPPAGKRADPYRVWLSEIMLQQTTVQAVAGYYRKFLERWPTVKDLAAAKEDDVLAAWAGLGYYARARNLHATAKVVTGELGGRFPDTAEGLKRLPGVGSYTSGAIAAIAYDERQAAMDANAERVIARFYAIEIPMPKAKVDLHRLCQALVPDRAGDFVQALMDLGSAICTPKGRHVRIVRGRTTAWDASAASRNSCRSRRPRSRGRSSAARRSWPPTKAVRCCWLSGPARGFWRR